MNASFGFINEKLEIKILILYILRRLPLPVNLETLTELAMCDGKISYFDFIECAEGLIKTEHITLDGGYYSITKKGIHNGTITEKNLPYNIRGILDKSTSHLRSSQMRDALIKADHKKKSDGTYAVKLSLSDGLGDVIKIELFAADEEQALELVKGFRKNAETAYKTLIETITKY